MGVLHQLPRIRFKGAAPTRTTVALLALNGVSTAALRLAERWSGANGRATLRVAVDGGLRGWLRLGRRCDLFVGDADSARPPHGVEAITYATDKSFSDFAGALSVAARRRCRVACVAGALGGRLDHELANLHEMVARSDDFAGLIAPTARGWIVVTAVGATIETRPGRPFSLFSQRGRLRCDLRGPRWPLSGASIDPGSRGLSNLSKKRLRLTVHDGVALLVFPNSEPVRR